MGGIRERLGARGIPLSMDTVNLPSGAGLPNPTDLLRLARGLAGADADDLVQDSFLAVLRRPGRDKLAPGYLKQTMRNRAREVWRLDRRRRAREETVARAEAQVQAPDELLAREELLSLLEDELARLPEDLRVPLSLRYGEGLGSSEIGQRLGLAAATVRGRLSRAREILRERLDRSFDGGRATWASLALPAARTASGVGGLGGAWVSVFAAKPALIGFAAVLIGAIAWVGNAWLLTPQTPPQEPAATPVAAVPKVSEPASEEGVILRSERSSLAGSEPGEPERGAEAQDALAEVGPVRKAASLRARFLLQSGFPAENVRWRASVGEQVFETTSDSSGIAELASLPLESRSDVSLEALNTQHSFVRSSLSMEPAEQVDLGDVVLSPGGLLRGVVLSYPGTPIEAARVHALGTSAVLTDENGRFELCGVAAGRTELQASAAGFETASLGALEVSAGLVREGLELRLEPKASPVPIEVRVVDPQGEPLAWGRRFLLSQNGSERTRGATSDHLSWTYSDEYTLTRIRSVREDVGLGLRWEGVHRQGDPELVLELEPLAQVSVQVKGAEGRETIARILTAEDEFEEGSYELEGLSSIQVLPEPFLVVLSEPGLREQSLGPFDPGAFGPSSPLVLELPARALLTGRVLCAQGPIEGASVELRAPAGTQGRMRAGFPTLMGETEALSVTDAEGWFEISLARDLKGWLVIDQEPRERWLLPLELFAEESSNLGELFWPEAGSVRGKVLFADGRNPAGTIVCATRGFGDPRTVRCASDGSYSIEGLAPGAWYVLTTNHEVDPSSSGQRGERPGHWQHPANVEIPPGGSVRFDLTESAEALRTVRLVAGTKEQPLLGATLTVDESESSSEFHRPHSQSARTDERGVAEARGPKGSLLKLRVRLSDRSDLYLRAELEPGDTDTTIELPVQLSELVLLGRSSLSGTIQLRWAALGPFRPEVRARLEPGETRRLRDLPAGPCTLSEWREGAFVPFAELELIPGEIQEIQL